MNRFVDTLVIIVGMASLVLLIKFVGIISLVVAYERGVFDSFPGADLVVALAILIVPWFIIYLVIKKGFG